MKIRFPTNSAVSSTSATFSLAFGLCKEKQLFPFTYWKMMINAVHLSLHPWHVLSCSITVKNWFVNPIVREDTA